MTSKVTQSYYLLMHVTITSRFEPPQSYCQMVIRLEKISMSSNQNCHNEYLTTGVRNPRICEEDMENIPSKFSWNLKLCLVRVS